MTVVVCSLTVYAPDETRVELTRRQDFGETPRVDEHVLVMPSFALQVKHVLWSAGEPTTVRLEPLWARDGEPMLRSMRRAPADVVQLLEEKGWRRAK